MKCDLRAVSTRKKVAVNTGGWSQGKSSRFLIWGRGLGCCNLPQTAGSPKMFGQMSSFCYKHLANELCKMFRPFENCRGYFCVFFQDICCYIVFKLFIVSYMYTFSELGCQLSLFDQKVHHSPRYKEACMYMYAYVCTCM